MTLQISPVLLNYRRVAEVWLDEYAEYLYRREPFLRYHQAGDLTVQKKFRETHRCQSFKVSGRNSSVLGALLNNFAVQHKDGFEP